MKAINILVCILILAAFLSPVLTTTIKLKNKAREPNLTHAKARVEFKRLDDALYKENLDVCPFCVDLMGQTLNQLLNIILNVGVLGTCSELCNYLSDYGQVAVVGCNLLCDYVGVKYFIKLVDLAELDPIWMCDELRACPIHDCTAKVCADFQNTVLTPAKAHKGDNVTFSSILTVYNQTSTGEME
jgi:hypothetical protein